MTDAVESMAYSGEVPWHKLGFAVGANLTPKQMCKAAKVDWTVSKRQVYFDADGTMTEVTKEYVLVRDSDNKPLTMVGETYKPVQNEEALAFFDDFCKAGHMTMETAGSLWGGRFIWGLARIGKDFELKKGKSKQGDEVRGYVLICQPHVHGKALIIQFTTVRVVCWNTLSMALGANLKGRGDAFRMPHSQKFDDVMKRKAEEALGISHTQMDNFQEAAKVLVNTKFTDEMSETFFCDVLQYKPDPKEKQREPLLLPKFRHALQYAPGADLITARGTAWGALNAVTRVIDHEIGRNRDTALKTAWLGNKANVKRKAMKIALEMAA